VLFVLSTIFRFSIGLCVQYCNTFQTIAFLSIPVYLINEVNLRRTRLVLRWVTMSGSIPGAGHLFQYVTNQPPKANSAFHLSGVSKWVPALAGKAKAGMVHSDSGWTRGVQVKLWDPLRTRAIPECLRGAFTTRRYTNPRLPLPLPICYYSSHLIQLCLSIQWLLVYCPKCDIRYFHFISRNNDH